MSIVNCFTIFASEANVVNLFYSNILNRCTDYGDTWALWPDWAIFCTLGNNYFTQNAYTKIIHFLVKPYLGNFYRHLAIFIWSHCTWSWPKQQFPGLNDLENLRLNLLRGKFLIKCWNRSRMLTPNKTLITTNLQEM